ncbi:Ribosomal L18p/L5e family protein [Perilla frutescens var. frutescens]|nr:Ribosomal L18p/L5e family protein [Perilla frutescens var. frutescens]
MIRTGIYRQAYRVCGSAAGRQFRAFSQITGNAGASSGLIKGLKIETHLQLSILGNLGMKLGLVRVAEKVPLPCALSFRSYVHSGEQTELEAGKNSKSVEGEVGMTLESIGISQLLPGERTNGVNRQPPLGDEVEMNLRSVGIDPLLPGDRRNGVNGQPPLRDEVETNLRSIGIDQPLPGQRRTRVNTRPPLENEVGRPPMSMDYVQGLMRGSGINGGPHYQPEVQTGRLPRPIMDDMQGRFQSRDSGFYNQPQLESNADIVHIKLMRNNSYVTLTDHKGDRKMSVSAGQVAAKGEKPGRYSGEAAAEYMGRVVKQMKIRSVVVKVSGFTFFRRKKDAILAFKDGYTHSRGDMNPVVFIEDTTRKPHNGCRLSKKRRI